MTQFDFLHFAGHGIEVDRVRYDTSSSLLLAGFGCPGQSPYRGPYRGKLAWSACAAPIPRDISSKLNSFVINPVLGVGGQIITGDILGIRAFNASGEQLWVASVAPKSCLVVGPDGNLQCLASPTQAIDCVEDSRMENERFFIGINEFGDIVYNHCLEQEHIRGINRFFEAHLSVLADNSKIISSGCGTEMLGYGRNLNFLWEQGDLGNTGCPARVALQIGETIVHYRSGENCVEATRVPKTLNPIGRVYPFLCIPWPARSPETGPAWDDEFLYDNEIVRRDSFRSQAAIGYGLNGPQFVPPGLLFDNTGDHLLVAYDVSRLPSVARNPKRATDSAYSVRWSISLPYQAHTRGIGIGPDKKLICGERRGDIFNITLDGQIRWRSVIGQFPTLPVVDSDCSCFIGALMGDIYKLDRMGQVLWSMNIGEEIVSTSLVIDANNLLYVVGRSGRLYCIE